MTTVTDVRQPRTATPARPPRDWVHRHPVAAFFVGLTYTISWSAWLVAFVFSQRRPVAAVLFVLGGLGPALAALAVTHHTGASVREWFCAS